MLRLLKRKRLLNIIQISYFYYRIETIYLYNMFDWIFVIYCNNRNNNT